MFYTDNPLRDFERYSTEQEEALAGLPICCECKQPIQTERCFEFDDKLICPHCMEENHLVWVDDYTI